MELDVDTFLTTVYCIVDDLYREQFAAAKPSRPGARPVLSDSEVLTLLLLGQWQADRKERGFLRFVRRYWRAYFPRLLSQSAFNRRSRDLWGVCCQLGPALAAALEQAQGEAAAYAAVDGVPVPLMRRCRGRRQRLFTTEAGLGRGGSDQQWYYGVHLVAAVGAHGAISGWVIGPANTAERWLADALLRWRWTPLAPAPTADDLALVLGPTHAAGGQRLGPTGRLAPRLAAGIWTAAPYLADRGFAGAAWEQHWRTAYGATLLHKGHYRAIADARAQRQATHWLCGLRQIVETAFGGLTDVFGLSFPRARTYWGLLTRLSAKVAAFNLAVYINQRFGRPLFAFFNPLG
jgi:hypothetical protein